MDPDRQHAPATLRNREPIATVLRSILPDSGLVLEVASGTGEHAVYFAQLFPGLAWQPSDPSPEALRSIQAWIEAEAVRNVRPPLELDAVRHPWPIEQADAVVCINLLHISPWAATTGLMRGAGSVLDRGAPLYVYGPFRRADRPLEPGNRAFDQQLRERDRVWGLRDLDEVTTCATQHGLTCTEVIEMPANNLSLVFRKE
jgi:Protein of unknown function (DUF938)